MAFILGYGTAAEWLRQNENIELLKQRYAIPELGIEASRTRLQRHVEETKHLTRPLHLITSSREDRRPSSETLCHLFITPTGKYPAIRLGRGIFCCGPEYVFVQMANLLGDEELLLLGMELCGRYGIHPDGELFERQQGCSSKDLARGIDDLRRVRGRKRAARVLPHVLEGACSPMEAALSLILHEPLERGGFGLPAPELNHALEVKGKAREIWTDDHITPDLLWNDARLAIEYDSDAFHTASSRIARDAIRRDVLFEMGYRVITVTTEHMRSAHEIERIANLVAAWLNIRLPEVSNKEWARRAAFQTRLRYIASHPNTLLAFSNFASREGRDWNVRRFSRQGC